MKKIGPFLVQAGPFRGGFAEVYHVFDRDSGDEFALKTLPSSLMPGSPAINRFRAEIDTWIRIPTHPNVVRAIRAFDHEDRQPCVLIEWIASGDLTANVRKLFSGVEPEQSFLGGYRIIEVMRQLCSGVAHIHTQGFIHGDLKPSNILMWTGLSPQITDFGLSRVANSAEPYHAGTRRYMAPELRDKGESTTAIDIYAAGMVFDDLIRTTGLDLIELDAILPIVKAMIEVNPRNRPTSFKQIEAELAISVERAPFPPGVPQRLGERLSWDEQHADVLPERSQYSQALTLLTASHGSAAMPILQGIADDAVRGPEARLLQAQIEIDAERQEAAAEQLGRIELARLTNPQTLQNLVFAWLHLERAKQAETVVDRLTEVGAPKSLLGYFRGWIAEKQGYVSDAINCYQKALDQGGNDDVRFRLAWALKNAGRVDESLIEFEHIGREHPEYGARVIVAIARIYVDTRRISDAKTILREALNLEFGPKDTCYLYCEQGFLLREERLFAAAIASYERALECLPDDRVASEGLRLAKDALTATV